MWRTIALYFCALITGAGAYLNQFHQAHEFMTWNGIIGLFLVMASLTMTWLGYSPLAKPIGSPKEADLGFITPPGGGK